MKDYNILNPTPVKRVKTGGEHCLTKFLLAIILFVNFFILYVFVEIHFPIYKNHFMIMKFPHILIAGICMWGIVNGIKALILPEIKGKIETAESIKLIIGLGGNAVFLIFYLIFWLPGIL